MNYRALTLDELKEELVTLKENLEEAENLERTSDSLLVVSISSSNIVAIKKRINEVKTLALFKGITLF